MIPLGQEKVNMNKLQYGRKILATKKASLIGRAVAMAPTGQFRSIDPVAYDYAKLGSKKAAITLGKKFYATLTRKTAAGKVDLKKVLALLGVGGLGVGGGVIGSKLENPSISEFERDIDEQNEIQRIREVVKDMYVEPPEESAEAFALQDANFSD